MSDDKNKVSFKDTLNLPKTDFPLRADAGINDPLMIKRWEKEDLYSKSFIHNEGKERFILHDGPPYSNGHIHLGHAYNKILKDIIGKFQRMSGKQVPIIPGWDCHGLPIEIKVSQEYPNAKPEELKKHCRAYAQKWIDIQREEFKQLGVLMDWNHPYTTMDFSYEAYVIRAFGEFIELDYIERKNKTVPWCPFDQTVLAMAEIEYQDRKDPSIYVLFPLEQKAVNAVLPQLKDQTVNLLVWTTTPWTLPLNRAVLLKSGAEYVVLDVNDTYILVAKALADKISTMLGVEKKIVAEGKADDFIAVKAQAIHPFVEELSVPLIVDDSVALDEGTAIVHCAPGCGPQDYEVAIKNNLEIFSPISPDGKYTVGIQPQDLEGMKVSDGQGWVINILKANDKLLHKTTITHPYPHCWRCHNPLIFRATKQWFCDLTKNDLKQRALNAIGTIISLPEKAANRLYATVEGRLEWCLSRQRVWGVPIPALLCKQCDYAYIGKELVDTVANQIAKHGIEYWDTITVAELLPKDFVCPVCKNDSFKKEMDILDVWFESGVSHYAVLEQRKDQGIPATMYAEGKDQHRAWFQSSLLTSLVLNDIAPMKMILTHGFTVDQHGHKMSKSLGNVVAPGQMIEKMGTDGLRLWVASVDYADDAVVSEVVMNNVAQVSRKIRNTCRFLLSNLYDFDIKKDAVPLEQLLLIDQYALQQLVDVQQCILKHYEQYNFTAIFHALADYCSVDLSAFYLDIIKDRLYVEKADGRERRSAQTACWYTVDALTKLMAPILSFTAEQVSDHYQKNKVASIHLQNFASLDALSVLDINEEQWNQLKMMRSAVLKSIEELRADGIIKHSLEARVMLYAACPFDHIIKQLTTDLKKNKQDSIEFFKEFLIVSQVELAHTADGLLPSELNGLFVAVERARGVKCPRCWQWHEDKHEHDLCGRCYKIVK